MDTLPGNIRVGIRTHNLALEPGALKCSILLLIPRRSPLEVILSSPLHLGVCPGQSLFTDKNQSRFLKAPAPRVGFPLGAIRHLFIHSLLAGEERPSHPELPGDQLPHCLSSSHCSVIRREPALPGVSAPQTPSWVALDKCLGLSEHQLSAVSQS